tara:strand:+ start:71 stop:409 length:339 start_codon:yes stop_codon:yes gene_type:complete
MTDSNSTLANNPLIKAVREEKLEAASNDIHPLNYVVNSQQGVRILNNSILDLLDEQLSGEPYSLEFVKSFRAWCNKYQVTYYSHVRECFNPLEGMNQALENRSRYLLMDDLS